MTPDERAFVDAILSNPADDTVRLVYADWLEEQGRGERAELIRAGVEIGRLGLPDGPCPPGCPCGGLGKRAAALVARYGDEWNPALPGERPGSLSFLWRRGFPSALACTLADFETHAAAVFALHPVEAVTLSDRLPWRTAVRDQELWGWWDVNPIFSDDGDAAVLPTALMLAMNDDPNRADHAFMMRFEPDRRGMGCGIMFRSRADAEAALSRVLVIHGRRAALLPPD